MTDIANMQTGELISYEPINPTEIEFIIRELGDRLEAAVPVIKQMWADRYAAERAFIKGHAAAMLACPAPTVTEKRAQADLDSLELKEAFDAAKVTLHAAEELQKALTTRLYGLLNINKALASAYQAGGFQR